MDLVEILLKKIENLEPLNNFELEKILNDDIYNNCHVLNSALDFLRNRKKELSKEKKVALKNYSEGFISKDKVEQICDRYELIIKYINTLENKNFEVRKKIKSKRIQLLETEKKAKSKNENRKNNYNIKQISKELEKNITAIILNKQNIIQIQTSIKKYIENLNKLIEFYNELGDVDYIYKIENLMTQLVYLEKINNLISEKIDKKGNSIDKQIKLNEDKNFLEQTEIETLKCFILQIKQLYIENIKLYNNIDINGKRKKIDYINCEISAIDKIINSLDKMLKSFSQKKLKIKKDKNFKLNENDNLEDINYVRNIIFNSNLEELINVINNNPEYCLLKNDSEEYLFEEYLNCIKNKIINSDIETEELYEFCKRILEILKVINKNNYLELEIVYNNFLHQFSNTIDSLENKNFDKGRLEVTKHFLEMINIEHEIKKNIDSDRLIEQIYPYHQNMKREKSEFSYEHIITIDNNEAKLLDTAYSFRKDKDDNYYIGIYIKDVNELLEEIDLEVLYKNFIRNKRMFGHDFAFQYLSLSVNKNYHKVLGHHFKIDKDFNVKSFQIKKETIAISSNLKYDDVREVITSDRNEHLKEILKLYHLIGNNITDCKRKYSLYNNVGIDSLNHNFMIFFNYYMAEFCKKNNIPSIFLIDKYYANKSINEQYPYGKYSCPARNFVSLINQLIYGIYIHNNMTTNDTIKIIELLETYAINLNSDSHDSSLKKAKKKIKN